MSEGNNSTTLGEFDSLIERAYHLKEQIEQYESHAEAIKRQLSEVQIKLLAHLEELDVTSFKSKWGTIVRNEKMSVKIPKDPDSKAKFFEWLEAKGIKEQILNINSQTLNSLYKTELEAARESGASEFSIPGIEPPTVFSSLTMRK